MIDLTILLSLVLIWIIILLIPRRWLEPICVGSATFIGLVVALLFAYIHLAVQDDPILRAMK